MTLKSLFFKLQKEDLKRRIWSIALMILAFFLFLPVATAIVIEMIYPYQTRETIIDRISGVIGPQYGGMVFITIVGAVMCGISGFFFLYSRKKVDFYHSIPVRRELIFAINYLNGFLIYVIPYAINLVISLSILKINNYMCAEVFNAAISAFGIHILMYLLLYTIVIIAVLLTGNVIVGMLGTMVFFLYGFGLAAVKGLYYSNYFKTYSSYGDSTNFLLNTSPIGFYVDMIGKMAKDRNVFMPVIITILVIMILVVCAVLLYQRRPSEASGKAMVFSVSKPIIKFALVILISLSGGGFFRDIVGGKADGWLIFGLIFTFLLSYAIIETIYHFDIRKAFYSLPQLLICAVIIGGIVSVFRFDLFRYDSYIPEKNEIQSMSVAVGGIGQNFEYIEFPVDDFRYYDRNEYQLKYMKLNNFEDAYELVQIGLLDMEEDVTENIGSRYGYEYQAQDTFEYHVKYTLENGRNVYRRYQVKKYTHDKVLSELYNNPEFQAAFYPINRWEDEMIGKITFRYCSELLNDNKFGMDGREGIDINLVGLDKKQFIEIYKEELNELTLEDVKTSSPILNLSFEVNKRDMSGYYIYPSFSKTIAFLINKGLEVPKPILAEDIVEIIVYDYRPLMETEKMTNTIAVNDGLNTYVTETTSVNKEAIQLSYKNQDQLKQIIPNLMENNYYYDYNAVIGVEENIDVTVNVMNQDYQTVQSYQYKFKKDLIPDFIKEDLAKK